LKYADQTVRGGSGEVAETAPPMTVPAPPTGSRSAARFYLVGAAACVVLAGATALWWLLRDQTGAALQGFEPQLEAAPTRGMPLTGPKFRKETASAFGEATANRALALAPHASRLRWTAAWPTRDQAEEKALEKCQQVYDEPCALIAVNDAVLPVGADGTW